MTIRDAINAGVQFQGIEIEIRAWDDDKETYNVLHTATDELYGVPEAVLDLEVVYIYAQNKTLVIEVEKRSY